jgi:hypothetical protein
MNYIERGRTQSPPLLLGNLLDAGVVSLRLA